MGNSCSVRGATVSYSVKAAASENGNVTTIRIITESFRAIELEAPVRVATVLRDFPGKGIFRQGDTVSPLFHHELLTGGRLYYLLPLDPRANAGMVRDVLPSMGDGVWRVRLAISVEHLAEILSEQRSTEALIERMRAHASRAGGAPWQARSSRRKKPMLRLYESV